MTTLIESQIVNPVTGVFGTGQMQIFGKGMSGSWIVPDGIGKVRVRCFGSGASNGGGGGGFTMKTIYDLTGVTSIPVIVAETTGTTSPGASSSFGSYCSATGGAQTGTGQQAGGIGVGGDINASGGKGQVSNGGGGVGSLFGEGGWGAVSAGDIGKPGGSGGGGGGASSSTGGPGLMGSGGTGYNTSGSPIPPTSGLFTFSIDFIGTGGGGSVNQSGINGGGGGASSADGGYPGGGGGASGRGGAGMVIVEW